MRSPAPCLHLPESTPTPGPIALQSRKAPEILKAHGKMRIENGHILTPDNHSVEGTT